MITKVVPSMKNVISIIKPIIENGSTYGKIVLMSTKTIDLETFVINDLMEFKTDFDGCLAFSHRLCHD